MELTSINSDNIFFQIYFWLLSIGVDKSRSPWQQGEYSRYELLTRWIMNFLFWVTAANIRTFSRKIHSSDDAKIKAYQDNHFKDLSLIEKHNDIIGGKICENRKVTDFLEVDSNKNKVVWAILYLMRKFDRLEIDYTLKCHIQTKFEEILYTCKFDTGILRMIREGLLIESKLNMQQDIWHITLDDLEKRIVLMTLWDKKYIRLRNSNAIIDDTYNVTNTYTFAKEILEWNYWKLINGCIWLRSKLSQKIMNNS